MVDASQFAGGDENKRIMATGDVVNGQQITGEGYHQAARSFQQDRIVGFAEPPCGTFYFVEIHRTFVYLGSQVRRAGIAENFGHGQSVGILGQQSRAHDAAVQFDVFRKSVVPRLDQFLGNRTDALCVP